MQWIELVKDYLGKKAGERMASGERRRQPADRGRHRPSGGGRSHRVGHRQGT